MAGSQRVQDYMQRHKIGLLFEDLMSKLVTSMPDEPLVFLNRTLERKITRQARGISPTRRSTSQLGTRKPSPDSLRRSQPITSAEMGVPKSALTKAVQSNTKRGLKAKTQKGGVNFEDSFPPRGRSPSPTRRGYSKPVWQDEEDEDLLYTGRRRRRAVNNDDISSEFSLAKPTVNRPEQIATPSVKSGRYGRMSAAQNHKRDLQALIEKQRQGREQGHDSGIETEKDYECDHAVEVIENMDDLRGEGVRNAKQTGSVRLHRSRAHQVSNEPQVRVSICARCAKIMGGEASEPADGTCYGELASYECDSEREFPQSIAHTARTDEEFESVSQVTGPRHPVWHGKNESTDRNLHQFSGMPKHSVSKSTLSGGSEFTGHNAFRNTWQPGMNSDTETERQSSRGEKLRYSVAGDLQDRHVKEDDSELDGTAWRTVDNYDSDATTDATSNRRDYQGAF